MNKFRLLPVLGFLSLAIAATMNMVYGAVVFRTTTTCGTYTTFPAGHEENWTVQCSQGTCTPSTNTCEWTNGSGSDSTGPFHFCACDGVETGAPCCHMVIYYATTPGGDHPTGMGTAGVCTGTPGCPSAPCKLHKVESESSHQWQAYCGA